MVQHVRTGIPAWVFGVVKNLEGMSTLLQGVRSVAPIKHSPIHHIRKADQVLWRYVALVGEVLLAQERLFAFADRCYRRQPVVIDGLF